MRVSRVDDPKKLRLERVLPATQRVARGLHQRCMVWSADWRHASAPGTRGSCGEHLTACAMVWSTVA